MNVFRHRNRRGDEAPNDYADGDSFGSKIVLAVAGTFFTVALALFGWVLLEMYHLHGEMIGLKALTTAEFARISEKIDERSSENYDLKARVARLEDAEARRVAAARVR